MSPLTASLARIRRDIIQCDRCPRLRKYCGRVAREKRAAYRNERYWARPVPGFGDPAATLVIIGLAPAAHGANRTGRIFTGDGTGGSGDFLMSALHASGLASQPFSRSANDGLELHRTWIAAAVRCAPPGNKPTQAEISACRPHLRSELLALPGARVYVALGRIAFDVCWDLVVEGTEPRGRRPRFAHGAVCPVPARPTIVASYHPSRQNTHTGRLTQVMLRRVFRRARRLAAAPS